MRARTYACSVLAGIAPMCAVSDSTVASGGTNAGFGAIAVRRTWVWEREPRWVGDVWRSSMESRDIFVVGDAERTLP